MVVLVRTAHRRYAVRRTDLAAIWRVESQPGGQLDAAGRPAVFVELGPLLDPADHGVLPKPQALVVPLRRRNVALLVERAEELLDQPRVQPVPALMHGRLREPWAAGLVLLEDELVVLLDLRAVARTVLLSSGERARVDATHPGARPG